MLTPVHNCQLTYQSRRSQYIEIAHGNKSFTVFLEKVIRASCVRICTCSFLHRTQLSPDQSSGSVKQTQASFLPKVYHQYLFHNPIITVH